MESRKARAASVITRVREPGCPLPSRMARGVSRRRRVVVCERVINHPALRAHPSFQGGDDTLAMHRIPTTGTSSGCAVSWRPTVRGCTALGLLFLTLSALGPGHVLGIQPARSASTPANGVWPGQLPVPLAGDAGRQLSLFNTLSNTAVATA